MLTEDPEFDPSESMRTWLENESEYPGVTGRSDTCLFEARETAALEEALARAAAFAATRRDELDIGGCSVKEVTHLRASASRLRLLVAMVTSARAKANERTETGALGCGVDSVELRAQVVCLVRKIAADDGSEAEIDQAIDDLKRLVPHPQVTDLIFYPPDGRELSPEEVADRALGYRLTPLGS